jgi:LPS export ABC transporter protein LptC
MHSGRYILSLVLLVSLLACTREPSQNHPQGELDSLNRPDSEVFGATIYLSSRGRQTSSIEAERLIKWEDKDSTVAFELDVDFFDSTGDVMSTLVADSGIIREKTGYMEVYGDVVVTTGDSLRLDTDFLVYDPVDDKVRTDAFVEIARPGDTLRGYGMVAPRDLSRIKILRQVTGRITNVPEDSGSL